VLRSGCHVDNIEQNLAVTGCEIRCTRHKKYCFVRGMFRILHRMGNEEPYTSGLQAGIGISRGFP
jgi:hypothetical protein